MAIGDLLDSLREAGTDDDSTEVKAANQGFPDSVVESISAFANRPGGGLVVFGLDERRGFAASGVWDATACQQAVTNVARQALQPPVQIATEVEQVEGSPVVLAYVQEADPTEKPVRVGKTGRAYIRQFDGDFPMSQQEEQLFLAQRGQPAFDVQPVSGAQLDDLDPSLLAGFAHQVRATTDVLASAADTDILVRTGVITRDGAVTLAGLLSLGTYPQQFLPNTAIQASASPAASDPETTRAVDARSISGPLPRMLDEAMNWVRRNSRSRITFDPDGHGRDSLEYPAVAARELIANALIHRDLNPHARSTPISLRLEPTQLVISNPGGLFGLSVESLGRTTSHCRNAHLMQIVQHVRTSDGRRIVERLGSGIPAVLTALRSAGMTPPNFHDQGIRFTVRVPSHALLSEEDLAWLASADRSEGLTDIQRHVLVSMRHGGEWTNRSLRESYPMDSRAAHRTLQELVDRGHADAVGERGQRRYVLTGSSQTITDPLPGMDIESAAVTAHGLQLLAALETPRTTRELENATGLTSRQVRYGLDRLRTAGLIVMHGSRGRRTVYERSPHQV